MVERQRVEITSVETLMSNSPRKAIVFLNLSYHPLVGGVERQIRSLAEGWAANQPVWVVTQRVKGTAKREKIGGVDVIRLWVLWVPVLSWITFGCGAIFFLARRRRSIGCLIAQMLNVATLPAAFMARVFKIPLLIKPSAGGYDGNLQALKRSFLGTIKKRYFLNASTYLIAINQEIASELEVEEVPRHKIRLIPNGVDTELFHPVDKQTRRIFREKLGLSNSDLAVLFVGRLEKVKNLDALVSLWPEVTKEVPEARLILVGDGPERSGLETQCIRDESRNIRFMGLRSDLTALYPACDVFVLPSFREGISNALLEAMACALPAVAGRVGGNIDVLKDIEANLLVDPNDRFAWISSLIRLLKDKKLREQIGQHSRRTIEERYSLRSVSLGYDALLRTVQQTYFRTPFPILAYHRVRPTPQYGIDVATTVFEKQIAWLASRGYRSIALEKFYEAWSRGAPLPNDGIVITFDDGHREVYEFAFPILKNYGFTATLFLNAGLLGRSYWVGGRKPASVCWHEQKPAEYSERSPDWRHYEFMSWDQAKELQDHGFEIGSHGVRHPFLTQLKQAELQYEVGRSKQMLEERMQRQVHFFCYPSGDFDRRVQEAVAQAGYNGAVVSRSDYDHLYYWDDPFAFERIGVWQYVTFWKFKALVRGWYSRLYRKIPRTMWELVRWPYRLALFYEKR